MEKSGRYSWGGSKMSKIDGSTEFNLNVSSFNDFYRGATDIKKVFDSYVAAGFTEEQALKFIAYLAAAMGKGSKDE